MRRAKSEQAAHTAKSRPPLEMPRLQVIARHETAHAVGDQRDFDIGATVLYCAVEMLRQPARRVRIILAPVIPPITSVPSPSEKSQVARSLISD